MRHLGSRTGLQRTKRSARAAVVGQRGDERGQRVIRARGVQRQLRCQRLHAATCEMLPPSWADAGRTGRRGPICTPLMPRKSAHSTCRKPHCMMQRACTRAATASPVRHSGMKNECASWPLSAAAAPRAAPQSAPATHAAAARRRRARAPASPAGARVCAAAGAAAAGAALASAARSLSRPGSCSARSRRRWRRTCSPDGQVQQAAEQLAPGGVAPWQVQEGEACL